MRRNGSGSAMELSLWGTRGVVHDGVVARHQPVEQPGVADVADDDELDAGRPGSPAMFSRPRA